MNETMNEKNKKTIRKMNKYTQTSHINFSYAP